MTPKAYCLLALLTALLSNTCVLAQEDLGTPEQRAACSPDAFRLCARFIPDPTSVQSCLRQRQSELSDPCRSVFEQSVNSTGIGSKARTRVQQSDVFH